jgi:hypothetical protein
VHIQVPEQEENENKRHDSRRKLSSVLKVHGVKRKQHCEQINQYVITVVVSRANRFCLAVIRTLGQPDASNKNVGRNEGAQKAYRNKISIWDRW